AGIGPGMLTSVQSRHIEVREGETASVDFVTREILVSGRASRSGAPLAGLDIRLMGQSSMSMVTGAGMTQTATAPTEPERLHAVTREDGAFELIVDGPGRYRASFRAADGRTYLPSRELEVPDAEAYQVELSFVGVSVSGVVVDKDSSQPVPLAWVGA